MKANKFLLISILAGSLFTACNIQPPGKAPEENPDSTAAVKSQPVKVMEIKYRQTAVEQKVSSTIMAFEDTYLSPALSGVIRDVKVEVNDRVKKGQLLAEMDRTQLDQTNLQYETLKRDMSRMDTLLKHGSVTQQSYDQMKAQVDATALILKNLEENTFLRAPYSGVITGKYYNDGELYSPAPNTPAGKAALVSIMQVDPVKLMVNLSEKYLPLISEGMNASVKTDVYENETFNGEIFRIHPTVSSATRTFIAEIKVSNKDGKLSPGMFARVSLKLGETEAMIVPAIAVLQQTGTNQRYVMLNDKGTAKKVVVQIVNRHDDQLEIASPELQGGEELVYAGQSRLENGSPVKVVSK